MNERNVKRNTLYLAGAVVALRVAVGVVRRQAGDGK